MKRTKKNVRSILLAGLILTVSPAAFATGSVFILAEDGMTGNPLPSATLVINESSYSFGTNRSIYLPEMTAGTYTVTVTTVSGYRPRESNTDPNAINDPTSEYGVPRYLSVVDDETAVSGFMFNPVAAVSGTVRDAWTMERLENTAIEFIVNSGPNQNFVCQKYPWTASYATNWNSDTSGTFPTNVLLMVPESYDLHLTREGYQSFTTNNVITNGTAGVPIELNNLFMVPVDNNTNQIADAWETLYFGSGSNVAPDEDTDGDGMNNRAEYLAGTDPTNQWSCLCLPEMVFSNQTMELSWETQAWRTYRIAGCTSLTTGEWVQVAGTWEATNGPSIMSWVETNLNLSWHSCYRVEVVPCNWQAENQVLINTNGWSSGGTGGSTTNLPPMP